MKKYIFLAATLFCALQIHAQSTDNQDTEIYEHISNVVDDAVNNLDANSDPYGFTLNVKMSKSGSEGKQMALYNLKKEKIVQIVKNQVVSRLLFDKYNLNSQPQIAPSENGVFFMSVGLTPKTAPQIGYDVNSNHQSQKESSSSITYKQMDIEVTVIFLVSSPKDGAILGKVHYKDFSGNNKEWGLNSFSTTPSEKNGKIRLRRLGPGDDHSNSGANIKQDEDWKPIGNFSSSDFQIDNRTPGHYFPTVKLRGCEQKFEKQGSDPEAIVTVNGSLSWDNIASAKASKETNIDVFTNYSMGNIVKGKILDTNNRPSKGTKTVVLESKDWEKPGATPDICITTDENFEFKKVESGIYYVYVKGQPKITMVEVCNCDGKGSNATYTCTIGGSQGCFITMETEYIKTEDLDAFSVGEYGSSGTGKVKETSKTKIVWHISDIEIITKNDESSVIKGAYDYQLVSYNSSNVEYQVPQFYHEEGKFIDEKNNWTTEQVPQASLPHIYQLNAQNTENSNFKLTDTFGIIPMFEDETEKKELDLSEIKDQGMKDLLESMEKLAKDAKPLVEKMNEETDGKWIEKTKTKTFTLAELLNVSKGSSMSLSDKIVRRTEKQTEDFLSMDSKTVEGMKKLGNSGEVDLNKMGKSASGGIDNFVMTNNYNRPVTTTITRKITLRRATDAEIKEAKVKNNNQIIEELTSVYPDGMIKKVISHY